MFCPVCKSVDLVMADRQGIEIDYCPTCRGVWLDRGELDKLIERSAQFERGGSAGQIDVPLVPREHGDRRGFQDSGHGNKDQTHPLHGRRRSFWSDLFD